MPVQYQIPPWLGAPADPAQHFGVGMQMGIRLGAEQAAQQFQQQQMLRQQQQDEFERQYKNTVLQMKVDDATRKQSAIAKYQGLIEQGVPQLDALKMVGPDIAAPEKVAEMEMQAKLREAQLQATQAYHNAQLAKRSPALLEAQDLANERDKLMALPEGSPERAHQQAVVDAMETKLNAQETEITSGPGGTTVRIGKPKKDTSQLTPTETSRLGEDLQATTNSLRVLGELQGQLTSNAVGLMPTLGSLFLDRILGQFDPGLVNRKRVESRQNIELATQATLGELNRGNRFSNMELQILRNEILPSLSAKESPGRAQIAVKGLRKMLAEKGIHAALSLKREIPTELLRTMGEYKDEDLAKETSDGRLDPAAFWKIYDFHHPELAPKPLR